MRSFFLFTQLTKSYVYLQYSIFYSVFLNLQIVGTMGVGLHSIVNYSIVNQIICTYNLSPCIFLVFGISPDVLPNLSGTKKAGGKGRGMIFNYNIDIVLWAGTKIYIL